MREGRRRERRGAALALLAALAIGGGCATRGAAGAGGATGGAAAAAGEQRTVARLVSRVRTLQNGLATLDHEPGSSVMTIAVALQGAPSTTLYGWRVTRGTCGVSAGALLGTLRDYPVLQVQADGSARAEALLPAERPSALSVRIYDGPELRQQVACGEFQ